MKNILILENVSYRYGDAKPNDYVLKDISFKFDLGKTYAIKGKSGSGKTTLLSLISGLEKCSIGKIVYNGQNLNKINLDKYRSSNIGIIFQSFNLLPHLTAIENIILLMDIGKIKVKDKRKKALELLEKVGLTKNEGDRRILKLSGGEQQRVAIARALAKKPKLLLCDEPTGALDSKTGQKVLEVLQKTCKEYGMTVVIITHNSAIAGMANRVIKMRNGNVSEVTVNSKPLGIKEINW